LREKNIDRIDRIDREEGKPTVFSCSCFILLISVYFSSAESVPLLRTAIGLRALETRDTIFPQQETGFFELKVRAGERTMRKGSTALSFLDSDEQ
jgi:hypothetical protein